MQYPNEIASIVRNKTLSVEAHLFRKTDDKPMEIFDNTFSRFVFTVIANSKAATCNLHVDNIADIKARTKYAHTKYMDSLYNEDMSDNEASSPAYTVRFMAGTLKGKTPVDVIRENGEEKGKEILRGQHKFLKENLEKYPANKKLIEAIADIKNVDFSKLSETKAVKSSKPIEILKITSRPLMRKQRKDGLYPCYECYVNWDNAKTYPVSVMVKNYFAPVTKDETGLLNVQISKKDKSTEISNEIMLTSAEWLNIVKKMENTADNFETINFKAAYEMAEKASAENRKANASANSK